MIAAPAAETCAMAAAPPIGAAYDDALHERTRGMASGRPMRVIHPDQPVTQDYRPERLNIEIDRHGHVARTWCG